jgi:hypothetical protein
MPPETINEKSPEYLFGKIIERLAQGDQALKDFKKELSSMRAVMERLPCADEKKLIADILLWQKKHDEQEQKREKDRQEQDKFISRTKLGIKNALVVATFSAIVSAVIGILVYAFFGGGVPAFAGF